MLTSPNPLWDIICATIQAEGGWIPFDRFQSIALYDRTHGYYAGENFPFGKSGDFVTAPQISPLFGTCIGNACAKLLATLGADTQLVEYGGGEGQLMRDVLRHCQPAEYIAIEQSPYLQQKQQIAWAATPRHADQSVLWATTPPRARSAIILANELWDAMPVRCFLVTETGLAERGVCIQNNQLCWASIPAPPDLVAVVDKIVEDRGEPFPIGYYSEVWLGAAAWLTHVFAPYEQAILLSLDYGFDRRTYYHPDRQTGTLMCHYQHRTHTNPFLHLGQQDITAHVDFSAIAEAAAQQQLSIEGFCPQAAFLLSNDLLDSLEGAPAFQHNAAIHQLTSPNEMGELVKAIAIGKNLPVDCIVPGFSFVNHQHRL